MPFCCKCGQKLNDQAKFCIRCGAPVHKKPTCELSAQKNQENQLSLNKSLVDCYTGEQKCFAFLGQDFVVSPAMDTFNYYRKAFKKLAKQQIAALKQEYLEKIVNLDTFLIEFPGLYAKYRQPILECAMAILLQSGVYDLSLQQFTDQHTADFCLCGQDVDNVIESFNLTVEANQNNKAKMYNMMPGMVFRGLGGFAAALAVNVATNAIAEADIRNANVTPKQRAELFARINFQTLLERAFIDYWRVFLSLTWQMNRKGMDVWYPNQEDNESAKGLYQNLTSGMLPVEKVPSLFLKLLQLNPYEDGVLTYIRNCLGETDETDVIFEYFDV